MQHESGPSASKTERTRLERTDSPLCEPEKDARPPSQSHTSYDQHDRHYDDRERGRDPSKMSHTEGPSALAEEHVAETTGFMENNYNAVCESFDDMNLREGLLRGVYAYGFEKPSAVQQRAIVPFIVGRDVIVQSRAGSGKTCAISVAILEKIDLLVAQCHALLLAPTREVAKATQSVVLALGGYMNVECHACVGGTAVREDMRKLKDGVHIVVGTPGRVLDMLNRRALDPSNIKMLVLDEADEVLSRGFKDQIYDIFSFLPSEVQVMVLSSTMPSDVLEVTRRYMRHPVHIRL